MPPTRAERGFTILELTIVIALIAVLAGILFPVYAASREFARGSNCRTNLHQIGIALRMYAADFDGRLPKEHNDYSPLVHPYTNSRLFFHCNSDSASTLRIRTLTTPGAPGARVRSSRPVELGLAPPPASPLYTSYQLRGGLTLADPMDTPVAADWERLHAGAANVLYLSGEVRRVEATGWRPVAPGPRPGGSNSEPSRSEVGVTYLRVPWKPKGPAPAPFTGGAANSPILPPGPVPGAPIFSTP
jgi:prepilin-type N-terminal cleavage/methylation domain-containing protein